MPITQKWQILNLTTLRFSMGISDEIELSLSNSFAIGSKKKGLV